MASLRKCSLRIVQSVQENIASTARGLRTLSSTSSAPSAAILQASRALTHTSDGVRQNRVLAPWNREQFASCGASAHQRCLSSTAAAASTSAPVTLSTLTAGGRKYRKRRARGGGDKTAGRGKNGQKSRRGTGSPALFFEGGQTPLWKRLPRRGFHNRFSYFYDRVPLRGIAAACADGRLDPRSVITMKHLFDAGLMGKSAYNRNGAYVVGSGPPGGWTRVLNAAAHGAAAARAAETSAASASADDTSAEAEGGDGAGSEGGSRTASEIEGVIVPGSVRGQTSAVEARHRRARSVLGRPWFSIPIQLEVANISVIAKQAIEDAGGQVTTVYYNPLGMRALLLPEWFPKKGRLLPHGVQMVPYKKAWRYDRVGALPPPSAPALTAVSA